MKGLLLAYSMMALANWQGGMILHILHGEEVSQQALRRLSSQSTFADLNYHQLCREYSSAHFNSTSNILHAVGMIATMWLIVYASTLSLLGFGNPKHFLYLAPLYYLPAWLGHFYFQKDIPAVFTYGTTVDGWVSGEMCAWEDLFKGGTIRNTAEFTYTVGTTIVTLGALMAIGGLWPDTSVPSHPIRNKTD